MRNELHKFESKLLGRIFEYRILIPEGNNLPSLYLLHGFNGDHDTWLRHTSLVPLATKYGVAVILPSCGNRFYQDNSVSVWDTSNGSAITSPKGRIMATVLFPLETSIPTAFITLFPSAQLFSNWRPSFSHCRFKLLGHTNILVFQWFNLPQPNATAEGWLTV